MIKFINKKKTADVPATSNKQINEVEMIQANSSTEKKQKKGKNSVKYIESQQMILTEDNRQLLMD